MIPGAQKKGLFFRPEHYWLTEKVSRVFQPSSRLTFSLNWLKGKDKQGRSVRPNGRTRLMREKIREAAAYLRSVMKEEPKIALITGTGLEELATAIEQKTRIPYQEIPHFPKTTTESHRGVLIGGMLSGKSVIAMQGRFHLYEGYSPDTVTFPVRVMAALGISHLFISSAAGGLNPRFNAGDLMLVTDHINLTGGNPLVGPNLDDFGPRFPDMSKVYAEELLDLAREQALRSDFQLREGVYVGVLGPSLETPAETRFLKLAGADAVGMSTVSEAIVGVHCGMKVMAIVAVTNINRPDCMEATSVEQVIKAAEKAAPTLSRLWEAIVASLTLP
jgi:purine-nucleoside phosphorylase